MKLFLTFFLCLGLAGAAWLRADQPDKPQFSSSFALTPPLPLKEPLKTVTTDYLVIQMALAADSVKTVPAAAAEMKKAVDDDKGKTFDTEFSRDVDKLVAATDLHTTRLAFAPLSDKFVAILATNHVKTGQLHSAFCPMVKASWIQQDGKTIHNPYMGSMMSDCGAFRQQF
jgi:hypothetical protein